nr:uncharacterized protein LOC109175150 [Ipomoea batatas]
MSVFSPPSSPVFFKHSNLQNLLSSVTPTVQSQAFKQEDGDTIEYFTLGDLWDCYEEWSAYGVGVPILLNGESVTQYYAPYLSAMQIYTNKPQHTSGSLKETEDVASVEGETLSKRIESDVSSKGSTDCSHNPSVEAEPHAHLYIKFCDTCSPYWRIPFAEKIAELAEVYPGLLTLKNIDLSPASWISVAWYPIYQIPTKGTWKDRLSTCFLTYHSLFKKVHSLSPSLQGVNPNVDENDEKGKTSLEMVKGEEGEEIDKSGEALYPFGMATYRLDDEIWINSHTYDDYEKIIDLYNAAESWLKKLKFWHHDFNFFTSQFSMEGLSM